MEFDSELQEGEATISLKFTGILNDKLRGFYRSRFTDDDGVEHTIATTQFDGVGLHPRVRGRFLLHRFCEKS